MSEHATPRMFCNPLDLEYRYQEIRFSGKVGDVVFAPPRRSVHREAADPSVVRYRDRYFMFASMSRGFWHSVDLVEWTYQASELLPMYDYAPDVRVVGDALLICASRRDRSCPFFRSVDPLADDFEEVTPGSFAFWDPAVFQDDDGRVYLYWGCDNETPIYVVELDDSLEPVGEPTPLISSDITTRGWERRGDDHVVPEPTTEMERKIAAFTSDAPYIEGAWMTRVGDRYYLQYSAPGTQFNIYADGYFTADSPLGPFEYSEHSPFSYKPGGFMNGAGHGSTFQDEHGNWWHAATMRISVNDVFERRVGIFPAGFDEDGVLYCDQRFADYPITVPDGPRDPRDVVEPEWMLLSSRASATASSQAEGHTPALAVDEDARTWWAAERPGAGEWVAVDLGESMPVSAVQVNLADDDVAPLAPELTEGIDMGHTWRSIYPSHEPALIVVEVSVDGTTWTTVHDGRLEARDRPHALLVLDAETQVRHVRVTAVTTPFESRLAVSGVRVFGKATGQRPAAAACEAIRVDELSARVEWAPVDGADGYNVRFGSAPDKLYRSWQVGGAETSLDVRSLNAGAESWFAVDAFNASGVTPGRAVVARR